MLYINVFDTYSLLFQWFISRILNLINVLQKCKEQSNFYSSYQRWKRGISTGLFDRIVGSSIRVTAFLILLALLIPLIPCACLARPQFIIRIMSPKVTCYLAGHVLYYARLSLFCTIFLHASSYMCVAFNGPFLLTIAHVGTVLSKWQFVCRSIIYYTYYYLLPLR